MDPKQTIQAVREILQRQLPAGYRTVLFGTWAKGTARPTSDIDIGVVGERPVPDDELMMQIRAQGDAIPTLRKIEAVDLYGVNSRFREVALEQAKPL